MVCGVRGGVVVVLHFIRCHFYCVIFVEPVEGCFLSASLEVKLVAQGAGEFREVFFVLVCARWDQGCWNTGELVELEC